MSSSIAMNEDTDFQSHELPEDYLSPRSKVARMLQDIEEDSTTSSQPPSPRDHAAQTTHQSRDASIEASSHDQNEERDAESDSEDDDDIIPRRPTGKALRRMLVHESPAAITSNISMHREQGFGDSPTTQHSDTLFVSPAKSVQDQASDSDDDLPSNPFTANRRLADLVATKRAERLEREQTERDRAEEKMQIQSEGNTELPEEMVEDAQHVPVNAELERILSDSARPTRKASKKAMLEMERETQRIAREQALTHQMKVKKKFSTNDLFARFKFRQPIEQSHSPDKPVSDSSSPTQGSDAVDAAHLTKEPISTPPSSPPTPWDRQKAIVEHGALARMQPVREDSLNDLAMPEHVDVANNDDDLSNVADIIKQSKASKANSVQQPPESPSRSAARNNAQKKQRLHMIATQDDDGELVVLPRMPPHLRMFDRVKPSSKETNNRAIHVLKHLAHLNQDPSAGARKKVSKFVAPDLVNAQLLALARVQARQAQDERLTELKAKGVVVMSVEEQEKEAEQFENLLEKERLKVAQLGKKERAAARNENGEEVVLNVSDDESEDADFEDDDELDEEASEDEPEDNLVEELAEEAEESDLEVGGVEDVDCVDEEGLQINAAEPVHEDPKNTVTQSITTPAQSARATRRDRKSRIVLDDEEDSDASVEQQPSADEISTQPEDPFAAFGFENEPSMHLLSPTQAFKATMQTPSQQTQFMHDHSQTPSSRQDQTDVGYFVMPSAELESTAPLVGAAQVEEESQTQLVPASQIESQDRGLDLQWDTMPETPLTKAASIAQETPGWQPSQDAGLPSPWTEMRRQVTQNALQADEEHETQSTVRVRISESPEVMLPKKKGRLTKGVRTLADTETAAKRDAFAEMQRRRMDSMNAIERAEAEREAKAMMDEQAEESEDEYAGLGGDDSNMIAPENAEDRAMFDETEQEVDEQAMAKFYAERQREAEEKATSKLFNDLTTGGLRRRQGVGWDLEEDEDERAARRRQMRQREEARKRKLLLQDENVKGLVESKGNSKGREAFLRTIGDDDDDLEPYSIDTEETSQSEDTATQPLQEISSNKRPSDSTSDRPLKTRRIDDQLALTKPTSMLQVRESLSFLLDGPEEVSFGPSYLENEQDEASHDDDDGDDEAVERARSNDGGFAPDQAMPPPPLPTDRLPASQRRTPAKPAVIDRLSLRRAGSSSSSASGASAWSTSSQNGSKAPSLLRRATSNLSAASANDVVKLAGNQRTKIGGSKKSSLAYQARAQERRAIGERAEKKRDEGRRKIAQMRREQGGALVTGAFGAAWE